MISDFQVGQVAGREHAEQVVVLRLPECYLHKISLNRHGIMTRPSKPFKVTRLNDWKGVEEMLTAETMCKGRLVHVREGKTIGRNNA